LGMAHLPVIVRAGETQQDLDGISKIQRAYSAGRIYRVSTAAAIRVVTCGAALEPLPAGWPVFVL